MPIKRSNISYADYSGGDANFCIGCTPASDGCKNCYARAITERAGRDFSQVCTYPDKVRRLSKAKFLQGDIPFRRGVGSRPLVFVVDMGDIFHDDVEEIFIISALFTLIERKDVDWLVLTKRANRMLKITRYMTETWKFLNGVLPENLWFGVTVENNKAAKRANLLRQAPVSTRWLSVEPMLEEIDVDLTGIDWVVCGGESGPKRRPFDKEWAKKLSLQCQENHIAYFFKQGSAMHPGQDTMLNGFEVHEYPR